MSLLLVTHSVPVAARLATDMSPAPFSDPGMTVRLLLGLAITVVALVIAGRRVLAVYG